MEDQRAPNQAVFSVLERAVISFAVMFLFGLALKSGFHDLGRGYDYRWWLLDFVDSLGIRFPAVRNIHDRLILVGTVVFGWDSFCRLREDAPSVARNLWFVVSVLLLGGVVQALATMEGAVLDISFWWWIERMTGALLPFAYALVFMTLAGELAHTARLRKLAAEMNEGPATFRCDRRRLRRQYRLIVVVRDESFGSYVAMAFALFGPVIFCVSCLLLWVCFTELSAGLH